MSDTNQSAVTRSQLHSLPFSAALALNRKNAALAIGISTVTLDRLVARGIIRANRACRRPLFSTRELERFLDLYTVSGASIGGIVR